MDLELCSGLCLGTPGVQGFACGEGGQSCPSRVCPIWIWVPGPLVLSSESGWSF